MADCAYFGSSNKHGAWGGGEKKSLPKPPSLGGCLYTPGLRSKPCTCTLLRYIECPEHPCRHSDCQADDSRTSTQGLRCGNNNRAKQVALSKKDQTSSSMAMEVAHHSVSSVPFPFYPDSYSSSGYAHVSELVSVDDGGNEAKSILYN